MRIYFTLLIFICTLVMSGICVNAQENDLPLIELEMRDYTGVMLPQGMFIPVINMQEISTQTCPEGYKVKFISSNDLYLNDVNVIPENTEFYGYIEKIHEPIIGTNASMKIKITKLVLPDGFELPIKAYVYSSKDNVIGGELTQPSEWVKMPHYQDKFQGISWNHRSATLQVRPGGKRSMGAHTTIPSGDPRLIILAAPLEMTHTYTD